MPILFQLKRYHKGAEQKKIHAPVSQMAPRGQAGCSPERLCLVGTWPLPAQVCALSFGARLQSQLPASSALPRTWPGWLPVPPSPWSSASVCCSWSLSAASHTWIVLAVYFSYCDPPSLFSSRKWICVIQVSTLYSRLWNTWRDPPRPSPRSAAAFGNLASSPSLPTPILQVYNSSWHAF